jgi:nucleoside-diphosphate-sugar epimerase
MHDCIDGVNVILGAGPVGLELAQMLRRNGCQVRLVSRRQRDELPAGAEFFAADLAQREQAIAACAGAGVVYCCIGIPYMQWPALWPTLMDNMLAGAAAAQARFVFADNLYMYGPQTEPLREDMPLTDYGVKPALRSAITRQWQAAHQRGDVRAVAVRASDFYGPGVTLAQLGGMVFPNALRGKPAQLLGPARHAHAYTYVPDFARALITLALAEDSDYGQAWHVPNAPTLSTGEVVALIYAAAGTRPRWTSLTPGLNAVAGWFMPMLRELRELRFQWDAPYLVAHTKFASRFWFDATPFEVGLPEALRVYDKLL